MKGPSIAVMLGGGKHDAEDEKVSEPGYGESKSSARDAAKALVQAVSAKDVDATLRAFRALSDLCGGMGDLEESGEAEDDGASASED